MAKDVERFIETGVLTKDDAGKAMSMNRADWIKFMKQKAGLLPEEEEAPDS